MTHASVFSGIGGPEVAATMLGWENLFHCEINEFGRQVLNYWYPNSKSYEDITKTDFREWRGRVDVLTGGFPCFLSGTKVLTVDGYKNIEDICVGDSVLTKEGDFCRCNATMKSRKRSLVKIKTQGIYEPITTTDNHPFWVCDELGQYRWKEAGQLLKGERVAFRCIDGKSQLYTLAFWRMIGRFVGDGWILDGKKTSNIPQGHRGSRVNSFNHKVVICSAKKEANIVEGIIRDAGYNPIFVEERTVCKFIICNKELCEFCRQFGRYALHKRIASLVFTLEPERKRAFFEGYLSADGYTEKNGTIKITTISEELALGTAQLARDIFHRPVSITRKTVNRECIIEGRKVNEHPQYCVSVSPNERYGYYKDGFVWCLIKKIEHIYERKTVYNIGVEKSETYTVCGIVVHNCQPFSYAGRRRGAEDDRYLWPSMYRVIDEIQPTWVVAENVAGILTMVEQGEVSKVANAANLFDEIDDVRGQYELRETFTLQRICTDLESHGYAVQPVLVPACAVGAPHKRDRVFIVARRKDAPYPNGTRVGDNDGATCDEGRTACEDWRESLRQGHRQTGTSGTVPASDDVAADSEHVRLQHDAGRGEQAADTETQSGRGQDVLSEQIQRITAVSKGEPAVAPEPVADTPCECGERLRPRQSEVGGAQQEQFGGRGGESGGERLAANPDSRRGCERDKRLESGLADGAKPVSNGGQRNVADTDSNGHRTQSEGRGIVSEGQDITPTEGCGRERPEWVERLLTLPRGDESIAGLGRWRDFPSVSPIHRGNDGLSVPPYYDAVFQTRNNVDRNSVIQGALSTGKIEVDFETGMIYSSHIRGQEGKKILLQGSECNGYIVHTLSFNGIKKQCRAHQIVWIAANGLYDKDKWQISHVNRDCKDNRLCNLRLVPVAENIANSDCPDTRMLGDEDRIKIWQMYNEGHMTLQEIAEDYGVSKSYIHKIVSDFPSLTISFGKWRTETLKAYGNAIVPQVMYEIFRAIMITEGWNSSSKF